jgi:predicted nuclease of restriction endonuclease-like RecB superfamily
VLTKDLLRVSRRGGGYRPLFAGPESEEWAARVLGAYQGHVDRERADLEAALADLETEAGDFKLVRGFAKLLEREATFETAAPFPPERIRRVAFNTAEEAGVVTEAERAAVLATAGERLGLTGEEVADALHADREARQVLAAVDAPWSPADLLDRYNLSLAQTALFDSTELRARSSDPRALVSAVKRLGLMYEIRKTETGRDVIVTGPDALFRSTRRYGTRFARLLRSIAQTASWRLEATIDDRGTERVLELSDEDPISVPGGEPVGDVSYDSGVEADFAARFESLDLDWELRREPEPLAAGDRVMIPDFAFDYSYGDLRVYFEIMGFWTPEYVEKKLRQLETLEDVEMLVAVDESLGVGEEIAARDHRVVTYSGSIRLKDVRGVLRRYEEQEVAESAAALPEKLRPDADTITLEAVAAERRVSEAALNDVAFPEHERVGRTLLRPAVLADLSEAIEPKMSLSEAEERLAERGVSESSAVLSRLGYEVVWDGLTGGTLRRKE